MKVILANPRGFCAGVNMAIEVVDQVLALRGPPVYVFHEIVHNRHVVEDFQRRGVAFVNEVREVPEGAVLVYSAHGISPEVRREARSRRLVEVDATCPLVTKVHMEVLRYAREGYTILFVGHREHDEAVGTVGEAPDSIASSRVRPVETQPGRSGTYTLNVPSSAGSMITVYSTCIILALPGEESSAKSGCRVRVSHE